jgi:hypothetical protein
MVAKARDKDLARMERQASMRGPLIAEMKQAVLSMRSPKKESDMFRQPSFRHLQTEPESTETIAMPHHGFRRQPPRQRTPNRRALRNSVSIGTAERNALRQYRQSHPTSRHRSSGSGGLATLLAEATEPAPATAQAPICEDSPEPKGPTANPTVVTPGRVGIRKPERRGSMQHLEGAEGSTDTI